MPSLLIVDDDRSTVRVFERCFEQSGVEVLAAASGATALRMLQQSQPDVVVLDNILPDQSGLSIFAEIRRLYPALPVVFITAASTSHMVIEAMRQGAMDYLSKPLDMAKMREVVAQAIKISRLIRTPDEETSLPAPPLESPVASAAAADAELVGQCPAMQEVYKAIGRVAEQNVNVLIRGESGTGKELIARAIHQHSRRADKLFLAVNCAAIPEALLESELFGHEKGSFTGAVGRRIGKFEQCDGGTLFLDEVGDMAPLMQSKVLRAIQEKEFERVGGNNTVKADVWIIAATNRDLEAMVASGEFRADLCYRLNGYSISLPPLRERGADILLLVAHYLRRFNAELGKSVTSAAPDALERLRRYSWPGNIRELQSVLRQAMLQTVGPVLLPEFLPPDVRESSPSAILSGAAADNQRHPFHEFIANQIRGDSTTLYADAVEYMDRILLTDVLRHTRGNQSQAAAIFGITRGCLRSKIRLYGITINPSIVIREPDEELPSDTAAYAGGNGADAPAAPRPRRKLVKAR